MITAPSPNLVSQFRAFAEKIGAVPAVPGLPTGLPCLRVGNRLVVLVSQERSVAPEELAIWLKQNPLPVFDDPDAYEIVLAVTDVAWPTDYTISRGIRLSSYHSIIANLTGIPAGWRDSQASWIEQTLEAVKIAGDVHVARLIAVDGENQYDAIDLISDWLAHSKHATGRLLYLRAEAGKGKSTLLAYAVRKHVLEGQGPLPIYLPLRTLQRDVGVSWGEIAARLGVVGPAAHILAHAVKSGLVALALDGLDEVAGRYDPTVVQAVIGVITAELLGTDSHVILSGRTTESALLDRARSRVVGIELPPPSAPDFRNYTELVVNHIAPLWPRLAAQVPEPPVAGDALREEPLEPWQADRIRDWIERIFLDFGKDRSLFFVQSLACIGRTYQLVGNKALVIESGNTARVAEVSLYDVCVLAAALACIREQAKIEESAQPTFTPRAQLELLTWLALRGVASGDAQRELLSPQELARVVFELDPTHQFEEFTAILRQMQKHALLFAGTGDGVRVGDWRPQFLSEWVRGALLCRAWQLAADAPANLHSSLIESAVATSERSRIAFQYFFAELAVKGELRASEHLVDCLCRHADQESPEAAANFWTLMAGIEAVGHFLPTRNPQSIPPMTDLSDLTFDGLEFGREFSATLAVFANVEFSGCILSDIFFEQCDFTEANFSGCQFTDVHFKNCDGPLTFVECSFVQCSFVDTVARSLPAITFDGCTFERQSRILQNKPGSIRAEYGSVIEFDECEGDAPIHELVSGEWTGVEGRRLNGYSVAGTATEGDRGEMCLRAVLKTFFPRRAGADAQLQARPYIRSSAIGRGRMPSGSPSGSTLMDILFSEGFTDGGREAHVYAPWSSVAGAGEKAVELRNELLSFLKTGKKSATVSRLLTKIGRAAEW